MPDIFDKTNDARHQAERWTSRVLRIGIWISAGLMTAGLLMGQFFPSTIVSFSSNPTIGNLAMRMLSGSFDPVTMMFAGLVFLMFTPIIRVIAAVFGFGVERDLKFVIVSTVVLLLLAGEIIYSVLIK